MMMYAFLAQECLWLSTWSSVLHLPGEALLDLSIQVILPVDVVRAPRHEASLAVLLRSAFVPPSALQKIAGIPG